MSKVLTFGLVVVLLLSLLCFFTASTFNVKAYANNLDNLPEKPPLPDWSKVTFAFDGVETIKDGLNALGAFFTFVGDVLAYPFQFISYITKTVFIISNGMLEKE